MSIQCFLIVTNGRRFQWLRRYSRPTSGDHYHNARARIEDGDREEAKDWPRDDSRWPTHCDCGYAFTEDDEWQLFTCAMYVNPETGDCYHAHPAIGDDHAAPPGAMWDQEWLHDKPTMCGSDGRALCVVLPNGNHWWMDNRASNCTMPDDDVHKCWVRHGEPPTITVDKNGNTCAAGAGSILSGDYHGFLQGGVLT